MSTLKQQMKMYRLGFTGLPREYISVHETAARDSLDEMMKKTNLTRCLTTEMTSDGWCDGMKVLRAVCEDARGNLHDMRWSDSNGGSWFEKFESGGAGLAFIPTNRPGYF